ncbi:soluble acyl-CoA diacylglycerolO-acyltransferase [Striga asiatica]|uniref:Soluble acyl-CoA diacylglycerolO-acyltransferase n=1 Tax=Striga asiatica TaxID=4170 RepID=A0A5A7P153_STRAF|nr:soluble acyl-CoA diacylglycerolO-acyltransferase [Striga asiatica]
MDASGVVLRQPLRFSSEKSTSFFAAPRIRASGILSSGFCDQSHVKYYSFNSAPPSCAGVKLRAIGRKNHEIIITEDKAAKKMKKKQLKLLKGLSRDLSTLTQIGFGLDSDGALIDQVKGNIISEASQLLLQQFEKLKAEQKELKRKKKEEKARLKGLRISHEMYSSSSSSESECNSDRGEIMDMRSSLSHSESVQNAVQDPIPVLQAMATSSSESKTLDQSNEGQKHLIKVCMGGKCKKSGAGALLEEFQRVVGVQGEVFGCKCMGKCRDGPNVKVISSGVFVDKLAKEDSLCKGVCLDDVNVIVGKLLPENCGDQHGLGIVGAC